MDCSCSRYRNKQSILIELLKKIEENWQQKGKVGKFQNGTVS